MILFDTPRMVTFRGAPRLSAHMQSDQADPELATAELLAFAAEIGLKASWLQSPGKATEHFDLFDSKIEAARRAGAVEVSPRELVERVDIPRRAALKTVLLVFGGRKFTDRRFVFETLDRAAANLRELHDLRVEVVRHGGAVGADTLGGAWAAARGLGVDVVPVRSTDWDADPSGAGKTRNGLMLERIPRVRAAVGFPGGGGTADMAARIEADPRGILLHKADPTAATGAS